MKSIKFNGKTYNDYKIDEQGNVFNPKKEKLKPWDNGRGYLMVDIMSNNKPVRIKIHIASIETYKGPRPKGMIVEHVDGNKHNNAKSNLSYITQQENVANAQELIKDKEYLSDAKLSRIRAMLGTHTMKEIADIMNVEYHIIRDIKNKKTYN